MLKKILLALLILIVLFLIVVQFQPSQYTVTRSEVISAPPETVFSLVNDFRNWKRWSPWADLDPNMKEEHEGASSGVGAVYRWSGNDDVGKGSMRITESRPPEVIAIDLEFQEPFASRAANRFDLAPDGSGVKVNWSMSGDNDFAGKAFSLLMGGMDKAIGKDFEKGLAKLKNVAEGR